MFSDVGPVTVSDHNEVGAEGFGGFKQIPNASIRIGLKVTVRHEDPESARFDESLQRKMPAVAPLVGVAQNGPSGGEDLEVDQNLPGADIAGMNDRPHTLESIEHPGVHAAMSVGQNADAGGRG